MRVPARRRSAIGAVLAVALLALSASAVAALDSSGEPGLIGGIAIDELSATRERPLFTPSRHPPRPPPPPAPKKVRPAKAEPPPEPPELMLIGVIVTEESRLALLIDQSRNVSRLALGDEIEGWKVAKVEPSEVELRFKDQSNVYRMFEPGSMAEDTAGRRKRRR